MPETHSCVFLIKSLPRHTHETSPAPNGTGLVILHCPLAFPIEADTVKSLIPQQTLCRVFCQEQRTQLRNRELAMQIIRGKLYEAEVERQRQEIANERQSQIGTGSRSEKIKTYNYKDSRMSDHRLKNNYPLENVMAGAAPLEQNILEMVALDQAEQLQAMADEVAAAA